MRVQTLATALPLLMLASSVAAVDCSTHSFTTCADKIVHWFDPDTGEICDPLDCGGGRAPPKTDVPGCPQYTGTETAATSKSYLSCWTPSASATPTTESTAKTTTESTSTSNSPDVVTSTSVASVTSPTTVVVTSTATGNQTSEAATSPSTTPAASLSSSQSASGSGSGSGSSSASAQATTTFNAAGALTGSLAAAAGVALVDQFRNQHPWTLV
ncbi:unnamed protein product [Penicillium manginii]